MVLMAKLVINQCQFMLLQAAVMVVIMEAVAVAKTQVTEKQAVVPVAQ